MVSGLMNWKQRSKELRSGTWNFFPMMVISTSFSYGRKGSDMIRLFLCKRCGVGSPGQWDTRCKFRVVRLTGRDNERMRGRWRMCHGGGGEAVGVSSRALEAGNQEPKSKNWHMRRNFS